MIKPVTVKSKTTVCETKTMTRDGFVAIKTFTNGKADDNGVILKKVDAEKYLAKGRDSLRDPLTESISSIYECLPNFLPWYQSIDVCLSTDEPAKKAFESKDVFALFREEELDTKDFICWDNYSGLAYALNKKESISRMYHSDYIGGIDNKYFDLKKAKEILDKIDYVSDVKIEDIPYYNREDKLTKGLNFYSVLPQPLFDKVWKKALKIDKRFPSCRTNDIIKGGLIRYTKGVDIYKLRPALKKIEEDV